MCNWCGSWFTLHVSPRSWCFQGLQHTSRWPAGEAMAVLAWCPQLQLPPSNSLFYADLCDLQRALKGQRHPNASQKDLWLTRWARRPQPVFTARTHLLLPRDKMTTVVVCAAARSAVTIHVNGSVCPYSDFLMIFSTKAPAQSLFSSCPWLSPQLNTSRGLLAHQTAIWEPGRVRCNQS